jgi:AcrR family transcriptional regulator
VARVRSEEYEDKRQSILDGAAALFAENGFERTSIAELALRCQASKAWIYHYYASKEAILFDMLDRHVRLLVATTRDALDASLPPDRQLRSLIRTLMTIYTGARDKHVVLLNDLNSLPADQHRMIVDLENEMVHIFAELIVRLNPALAHAPEHKTPIALSLLGMVNWTYTWFRPDGPLTAEQFADLATDLFLGGIGNPALARPETDV